MLVVNCKNNNLNIVALLHKLTRVTDLLCPREIGDVHEAINAWLEFDEDTKVCEVPHVALMNRPNRVLRHKIIPWIRLELFHAKSKLAIALVDVENNRFYHLTKRYYL